MIGDAGTGPCSRRVVACLVAIVLFAYAYFPGGQGWNQNSRLALTLAIVDHGEFSIDRYHDDLLPTADKAYAGGRYYSDKAIGSSVAGIVPYALARPVLDGVRDERRRVNLAMYWVTVTTVALPAALCLGLIYCLAVRVRGDPRDALFAPVAVAFGTPLWSYGAMLFGHVLAAALLFAAFRLTRRLREPGARHRRDAFGAAVAAGFGVITEYTLAPVMLVLAVYAVLTLRRAGRLREWGLYASATAGVALPLGLLLAYNEACFGSPWILGYQSLATEQFRQVHAAGLVGIGWPSPEVLWYLTLHPVRGLLVHAPVLLLVVPGLWAMHRTPEWRLEAWTIAACFGVLLCVNAGFGMWWGGWSANARHLVPVLLLLAVPLAFVDRPWRTVAVGLLIVSVVQTFVVAATTPMVSDAGLTSFLAGRERGEWIPLLGYSPIYSHALHAFAAGELAWTPFGEGGGSPVRTIAPLAAVGALGTVLLVTWTVRRSRVTAP